MEHDQLLPGIVGGGYEPGEQIPRAGTSNGPAPCYSLDILNDAVVGGESLRLALGEGPSGISKPGTEFHELVRPEDREFTARANSHASGGWDSMTRAFRPDERGASNNREVHTSPIRGDQMLKLNKGVVDQMLGEMPRRQAEEHAQVVVRRAADIIFVLASDGTLRYPNSVVEEVLGHRPNGLRGSKVSDLVHPDDLPQLSEALALARLRTDCRPTIDLRFRCSDGTWRCLLTTADCLAGDVPATEFVLNARDATACQQAEADLLHLAAFKKLSNDAIFSSTLDGIILTWSRGAHRLFGYTAEEIQGRPVSLLIPADRTGHHPHSNAWLWRGECIEQSNPVWIRKDGQKINVIVISVPIRDEGGRIIAVSTIVHDISERTRIAELLRQMDTELERRVEERTIDLTAANTLMKRQLADREQVKEDLEEQVASLRDQVKLLELAHHAILVRDFSTGTVLSWNSGAEEMYGWTKDEAVGRVCDDLLQTRLPQPVVKMESELLQMGHWEGELEQTRRSGNRIVVECRRALRRDERGQPTAIMEITRDITVRRQVEEERAALLAAAQEVSNRLADLAILKADFTAMVAHELSAPIAAISRLADMLTHTQLRRDDQDRGLAMIRSEAKVLQALVQDVQVIAKTERNDFTIRPQAVPVAVLLADAAAFNQTLPGRHQLVTLITTHQLVRADRERVGQVLRNLIGNAAKYSPDDSSIELRTSRRGDRIRIEVVDHGPGIHRDDLRRIFEKFARGRDERGRRRPGTGLGLYLSRRIARAHGGDLTVESTPGVGSVFGFDLEIV